MLVRCGWADVDPLMRAYHDQDWGTPQHDDRALFELLVLEGAQAGLSWLTILRKRDAYRRAFDGFHIAAVARYTPSKLTALLGDAGIVRNRLKIAAAVQNARCALAMQRAHGSLDAYLWQFVQGRPKRNHWKTLTQVPCASPESEAMSRTLRQDGFAFVGPTICYAFMQAAGLVNDHLVSCFRHSSV